MSGSWIVRGARPTTDLGRILAERLRRNERQVSDLARSKSANPQLASSGQDLQSGSVASMPEKSNPAMQAEGAGRPLIWVCGYR